MKALVVFTAIAAPLAIAPGLFFFHDVIPKAVIILMAAAAAALSLARHPAALVSSPGARWFTGLLCTLAASTLISTVFAAHAELAWAGSDWRRLGAIELVAIMLIALAVAAAGTGVRNGFLRAVCVTGAAAALYGIAQYLGFDPFLPRDAYRVGEGVFRIVRPPATLGHSDYFGAFLVWPVFAGIGVAYADPSRRWRYFGAIASGMALFAIALTGSRAAVAGALCGFCCLALLSRRAARIGAAAAIAAVILCAAVYLSPSGQALRARLHWIGEERAGGARLLLWRDSLSMAAARPALGYGPENFIAAFPQFQSVELSRAYPDFYHESPHNFVLDALIADGIPGAVLLLAVIALGIRAGVRSRDLALLPALAAAVVAHQFSVLTAPTAFYLFAALALLTAESGGKTPLRSSPSPSSLRLAPMLAASALAALFCGTAWRFAETDRQLASIRRALDAGDYRAAADQYRQLLGRRPPSTADLYFSRRWASAATHSTTIASKLLFSELANMAANRATQSAEVRANAWYNLAAISAAGNRPQATEAALRSAVQAAPNWFKPHWALARLLRLSGRRDEAAREAQRAFELNGGKDAEVAATFERLASR
jgi:O-antigen ligase